MSNFQRFAIKPKLRFRILTRDGYCCHYCGVSAREARLHVDHFVPVAKGGTNDPANLRAACQPCNLGKGTGDAGQPFNPFHLKDVQSAIQAAEIRTVEAYLEYVLDPDNIKAIDLDGCCNETISDALHDAPEWFCFAAIDRLRSVGFLDNRSVVSALRMALAEAAVRAECSNTWTRIAEWPEWTAFGGIG